MKSPWVRGLIALGTLALLAWLLHSASRSGTFDLQVWWARLAGLPAWLWALVPLGMALSYLCRAARIHAELSLAQPLSQPVTLWHCLRLSLVHNLAIHLVPMRGGELAYPALLQRELGVPLGSAMASLAWMRLQDALVLLAAAALLAPLAWPLRLGTVLLAGAALVAAVRWARGHAQALQQREHRTAAAGKAAQLWRAGLQALTDPTRHTGLGWLYCAANWGIKLGVIGTILAALTQLPALPALRGALGGELAALSPLQGPSGLGTYEAGVWLGAGVVPGDHAGVPLAALALAALTAHALIFLTALVAGLLAMLASRRHTNPVPPATAP